MLLTNHSWVEDSGCRLQRIYRRVDTKLYDGTGKYRCRIQMCECSCRCRVCQVIGWHIDCLYRCDRTILCRSDTLLQCAHLCLQGWLITNGRRHTSKQCRYLRTSLCKTEDIVDEQQYILSNLITEILCHREACQTNTHSCSWRFIHLTEYHRCLLNNAGFDHLVIQVISFSCSLTNTGKYRISTVLCRDICDKLLNQYCLTNTGTTEQTDLTTLLIRAKQVNDLNTGFQNLCLG